ncbi:hypothetical protein [Saudi moumouvirus]|nr:hypothetical protein [Saudi moumouvirus]
MKLKYIPAYNIDGTNTEILSVPDDIPVYSMYTGNIIGFGNILWGTLTDAPIGHKKHGEKFYVIVYNPEYNMWLAHSNIPDLI